MEDNKLEIVTSPGSVSHSFTSYDEWMIREMKAETKGETGGNYQYEGPKVPRVPSTFRRIVKNKNCYDPSMVSLGPYHHGKRELREMEELKLPMARQFVRDCKLPFEAMWREVKELNIDASKCYEEGIIAKFNKDQFAQMMFLDGCFILQFVDCFMRKPENLKMSSHDAGLITKDLFLLENQLPFSVLKSLMSFTCKTPDHGGGEGMELFVDFFKRIRAIPPRRESCRDQISKYFGKLVPNSLSSASGLSRFQREPAHLLDFFHTQFVVYQESPGDHPSQKRRRQDDDSPTIWHRYYPAVELRDSGIHFKPSKTSNFTDVQFKPTWLAGRLYIPPLSIDDSTKPLLLNLIAYEATAETSTGWVTSYVCFMDSLIDHPEDVKELRSQGILLSALGSDKQVADLFNGIAKDLVPNPYAYGTVKRKIESECKKVVNKWVAEWRRVYFSSPWTIIAVLAAIFTIALTAIQTYIAAIQFLRPPKDRC